MHKGINMQKTRGFSYLEMVVALALFGIALTGTTRLVVMQSRQVSKVEGRLNHRTTSYLVPSADAWARKLGAAAAIESVDPGPPPVPGVTLIDDGDPGYSEFGPNWHDHVRTAYQGQLRCNDEGGDLAVARWEFPGLTPREYTIFATWEARAQQATNAPYTVYDGAVAEGTVTVDMQVVPSGELFEGVLWESLGAFSITSGILRVELSDDADEKVVADAVRIVPGGNQVEVISVQKPFG
ncbi:MAG: prepilin-type N-terminal cleavage/methylation domain-containing protein, partial [Pirellulales bacterium]